MVSTETLSDAAADTPMLLAVQAPFGGLVIRTDGAVVSDVLPVVRGVTVVTVPPVAPDVTSGDVPSLLMMIPADTVRLPAASTATAFTSYAAFGSGPVSQPTLPLQLVPEQVMVPKTPLLPQSSI